MGLGLPPADESGKASVQTPHLNSYLQDREPVLPWAGGGEQRPAPGVSEEQQAKSWQVGRGGGNCEK